MTAFTSLRLALAKHAAYRRTRRELANLPLDLAIHDLGIYPGDADLIARRAVYG